MSGMVHSKFASRFARFIALAAATLLSGANGLRAEIGQKSIDASVTIASDYVFRGISQTLEDPALQLGLGFEHPSGFFAGVWGSNVDFPGNAVRENPRDIEVDLYLGFSKQLVGDLVGSALVTRYEYPDSDGRIEYSYNELGLGFLLRDQVGASVSYSDDFMGQGISSLVFEISGRQPLPHRVDLNLGLGYQDLGRGFVESYGFWSLGVSTTRSRLTIDLSYIGTDEAAERVFGALAGNRVVLTVTGNFTIWEMN